MENGLRTMNISSLNPDWMKAEQMQRDITKDLTRDKIHIAEIQETHNTQERDYLVDNYRLTTAAATKRGETGVAQGGTAIMIRESMQKCI